MNTTPTVIITEPKSAGWNWRIHLKGSKHYSYFYTKERALNEAKNLYPTSKIVIKPFVRRAKTPLPFCKNDLKAIRGSEFVNETQDCTVVALSQAAGIPYPKAHGILAMESKRIPRQGAYPRRAVLAAGGKELSITKKMGNSDWGRNWGKSMTLKEFVGLNPLGTFYLCNRNHAYVLYDGMVFDHTPHYGTERLTEAYQFGS